MPEDLDILITKAVLGVASEAELCVLDAAAARDEKVKAQVTALRNAADLAAKAHRIEESAFTPVQPPDFYQHRLEEARQRAAQSTGGIDSTPETAVIPWWRALLHSPVFGTVFAVAAILLLALPMLRQQIAPPPVTGPGPGGTSTTPGPGVRSFPKNNGRPTATNFGYNSPDLLAPRGEIGALGPVIFTWKAVPDTAVKYDLSLFEANTGQLLAEARGVRPPVTMEALTGQANLPAPYEMGTPLRWTVKPVPSDPAAPPSSAEFHLAVTGEGAKTPLLRDDASLIAAAKAAEAAGRPAEALMLLLSTSEDAMPVDEFLSWRKRLEQKLVTTVP